MKAKISPTTFLIVLAGLSFIVSIALAKGIYDDRGFAVNEGNVPVFLIVMIINAVLKYLGNRRWNMKPIIKFLFLAAFCVVSLKSSNLLALEAPRKDYRYGVVENKSSFPVRVRVINKDGGERFYELGAEIIRCAFKYQSG